jgi:accessory colonization factor AcfC
LVKPGAAQDVPSIHVYGPGGPSPAMLECAHTFNSRNGANVMVTFGPTARWREAALHDADLFYSGAENMMTDFVRIFRQIDQTTIDPLYVRRAIIMVHRGNPLKINSFTDLLRPGVHIMIVQGQTGLWEGIAGRVGDVATIRALRRNIVAFAQDTATAHRIWNSSNPPDAWIALASEHGAYPDESDAIELESNLAIVRDAGIALANAGASKPPAKLFTISYSPEGLVIFKRWGWSIDGYALPFGTSARGFR